MVRPALLDPARPHHADLYPIASQPYPKEGEYGITFDQFIRACVAVQNLVRTFEQFNGPRDRRHKSDFENFVLAAVSTLCL